MVYYIHSVSVIINSAIQFIGGETYLKQMEKDIIEFIEENKEFLLSNNIDIAHSYLTDRWYVYRYDTEYHYYDYYIEFSSLQELNNILLEEMEFLLSFTLSDEVEIPSVEYEQIASQIEAYRVNNKTLFELRQLLEYITTSTQGKDSKFFQLMDKLYINYSEVR